MRRARHSLLIVLSGAAFGCGSQGESREIASVSGVIACGRGAQTAGHFCEVTRDWGIRASTRSTEPEGLTGGATSADFDGDGRNDLLAHFDGDTPIALWLNRGGRFEQVTALWGLDGIRYVNAAASADLDGDGDADLLLHSRARAGLMVLRNTGAGFERLGAIGDAADYTAIVPADIDRDGWLDLVAAAVAMPGDCPRRFIDGCPAGVRAWRQRAPWDFTPMPVHAAPRRAQAIRWHDLDADGRDELLVTADFGMLDGGDQVLRPEGAGDALALREAPLPEGFGVEIFGMGIAPIDVDRDGRDEVLLTNFGRNVLLRARGGRWVDDAVALGADAYGIPDPAGPPAHREFDPAGRWMGPMGEFQSRYIDLSSELYPTTKWTPLVFDYDQDGVDDVFIGAGYTGLSTLFPEPLLQSGTMLRGDGARLRDVTEKLRLSERHGAHFPVAADLDGDGDLDLAAVRPAFPGLRGGLFVMRNDASVGRALWVVARGRGGARDGIGATVRVTVGGRTVTRRLDGNHSIAGSGPHGVHVGLGDASRADAVEVRFVSGEVRRREGVPAGRVVIEE